MKKNICLLYSIFFILFSIQLQATPAYNQQYLTANGGNSVDMDASWIVVGDSDICELYTYEMDYSTMEWIDKKVLDSTPSGCSTGKPTYRGLGKSVTIAGDIIVAAATLARVGNGNQGTEAGRLVLYLNSNGDWSKLLDEQNNPVEIVANDPEQGAHFGEGLSVSKAAADSDYDYFFVVGAPNWGNDKGKVYIYKIIVDTIRTVSTIELITTIEGENDGDLFGSSVVSNFTLSGREEFLIGAPGADTSVGTNAGKAYLYELTPSGGLISVQTLQIHDLPPQFNPEPDDAFGATVSLSSKMILVGGNKSYVFSQITAGGPWTPLYEVVGVQGDLPNGADVSQNVDAVGGFGLLGKGVDIYPDAKHINPGSDLTQNYHIDIDMSSDASSQLAYDIRMYSDMLLVADSGNNQARSFHFPCGFGKKIEANEWHMISVPCKLPTGTSVVDAFNADDIPALCEGTSPCSILGEYGDDKDWVVWEQEGDVLSGQPTHMLSSTDEIIQGKSYWIISNNIRKPLGGPIYIYTDDSISQTKTDLLEVDETFVAGYYDYTLSAPQDPGDGSAYARIMVGNAFPRSFLWRDVSYMRNGTTMNITEAAAAGYMNDIAYVHDKSSTTGQPYKALTLVPGFENLVRESDGFWIRLEENATAEDKLRIPLVK